MADREELRTRYLEARILKEERAAEKLRIENEREARPERVPIYKNPLLWKPLAAGVTLAILLAGYTQYVFLPATASLTEKAETAEFVLQQAYAKHEAQIAKLELVLEKINFDGEVVSRKLDASTQRLTEAQEQNKELKRQIAELSKTGTDKKTLADLSKQVDVSGSLIDRQLAQAKEMELKVDGFAEVARQAVTASKSIKGWIYVGYYPGEKWDYKTLDIDAGKPVVDVEYGVTKNVNVRNRPPKFTLFGYKFGDAIGAIAPGDRVRVLDVSVVGLSKVWAEVESVNGN